MIYESLNPTIQEEEDLNPKTHIYDTQSLIEDPDLDLNNQSQHELVTGN